MTKIRCQVCGGENLYTENGTTVVCSDCGNRTILVPEIAILRIDERETENEHIVTIQFDKRKTECPRKGICLNDTMEVGGEPCRICNVVRSKFERLTADMINKFDERQQFVNQHPELYDEYKDEQNVINIVNDMLNVNVDE